MTISPQSPYQLPVLAYLVNNPQDFRRPALGKIKEGANIPNISVIPKNLESLKKNGYLDSNYHPTRKGKKLVKELANPAGKTEKSNGAQSNNSTEER